MSLECFVIPFGPAALGVWGLGEEVYELVAESDDHELVQNGAWV